jgi:hypothetical protein
MFQGRCPMPGARHLMEPFHRKAYTRTLVGAVRLRGPAQDAALAGGWQGMLGQVVSQCVQGSGRGLGADG